MSEPSIVAGLFQTAVILGAFWGLLKWTVTDKLNNIASDISDLKSLREKDINKIHDIDTRVARIEEWRKNEPGAHGRRKTDVCPAADCPFEGV